MNNNLLPDQNSDDSNGNSSSSSRRTTGTTNGGKRHVNRLEATMSLKDWMHAVLLTLQSMKRPLHGGVDTNGAWPQILSRIIERSHEQQRFKNERPLVDESDDTIVGRLRAKRQVVDRESDDKIWDLVNDWITQEQRMIADQPELAESVKDQLFDVLAVINDRTQLDDVDDVHNSGQHGLDVTPLEVDSSFVDHDLDDIDDNDAQKMIASEFLMPVARPTADLVTAKSADHTTKSSLLPQLDLPISKHSVSPEIMVLDDDDDDDDADVINAPPTPQPLLQVLPAFVLSHDEIIEIVHYDLYNSTWQRFDSSAENLSAESVSSENADDHRAASGSLTDDANVTAPIAQALVLSVIGDAVDESRRDVQITSSAANSSNTEDKGGVFTHVASTFASVPDSYLIHSSSRSDDLPPSDDTHPPSDRPIGTARNNNDPAYHIGALDGHVIGRIVLDVPSVDDTGDSMLKEEEPIERLSIIEAGPAADVLSVSVATDDNTVPSESLQIAPASLFWSLAGNISENVLSPWHEAGHVISYRGAHVAMDEDDFENVNEGGCRCVCPCLSTATTTVPTTAQVINEETTTLAVDTTPAVDRTTLAGVECLLWATSATTKGYVTTDDTIGDGMNSLSYDSVTSQSDQDTTVVTEPSSSATIPARPTASYDIVYDQSLQQAATPNITLLPTSSQAICSNETGDYMLPRNETTTAVEQRAIPPILILEGERQ